jgi:hypothetical protein
MSPVVLAVAIGALVACVGVLISERRKRVLFADYEEVRSDVRALASHLKGVIFRQGAELVVTGNNAGCSTTIRFSHQENTPGVYIRMHAPALFTLFCAPKQAATVAGRARLLPENNYLASRFQVRSDHPTEARLFLAEDGVVGCLQQLCCSARAFFTISDGALELTELSIPDQHAGRHFIDHLVSMRALLGPLRSMPNADHIKVPAFRRERHVGVRAALAACVVVAVATVIAATEEHGHAARKVAPVGVREIEADQIPNLSGWRRINDSDYDGGALSWLRGNGQDADFRIEGDFSGTANGRDAVYVFRRVNGDTFRVVLLVNGEDRYDVNYDSLAVVARFPKALVENTEWAGQKPAAPDGDGVLIALPQAADGSTPAVVLFVQGRQIISGAPTDYQHLNLR